MPNDIHPKKPSMCYRREPYQKRSAEDRIRFHGSDFEEHTRAKTVYHPKQSSYDQFGWRMIKGYS